MEFLGHVELSQAFAFFIAETAVDAGYLYPADQSEGAQYNDRVIARIEWEKNKKLQGEVVLILDQSSTRMTRP